MIVLDAIKSLFKIKKGIKEVNMDTKKWYTSRTIWGGLLMGAATLLQFFGLADMKESLTAETTLDTVVNGATALGEIVGFIMVIYGRIKASKQVTT